MKKSKVLVLPMAGYGNRFIEAGYALPKQFLRINGKTCLEYSLDSLDLDYFDRVIIGCREEFERQYNVEAFLRSRYENVRFSVCEFDSDTNGSLDTVYQIVDRCDLGDDCELSIFTLDVNFSSKHALNDMTTDAEVLVVKTNNPGFSFAKVDDYKTMTVIKTAEKRIISEFGAVGLYRYKNAAVFKDIAAEELNGEPNYKNEHFICPLYNRYLDKGHTVKAVKAEQMVMFGTPIEYEFCKSLRQTTSRKIAVASDHSGFQAKEKFIRFAEDNGYLIDDFGCYSESACDYFDFVSPAALSVAKNINDFAVSFCDSGQGVNIAASAHAGIRSSLVYDPCFGLEMSLKHNAPNHFSVPSKLVNDEYLEQFFVSLEAHSFEGGRHQDRLTKVLSYETK